jgi:hypothetical protein
VTPSLTRGLLPDGLVVPISLGASVSFFGASGLELTKDDFFTALSASDKVHVLAEGTYDASHSQFAATEVRLQDADSQPHVKVAGVVSDPQSAAQTFGLTVSAYQGLMTKPGAATVVAINASTTFVDEAGKGLSADQFFGALASPMAADVDGVLDTSTGNVVATTVKLSAAPVTPVKGKNSKSKSATVAPKK